MCGICGRFNYASGRPVPAGPLKGMTDRMVHRGPDDEGFHIAGAIGLGFRRLSIIDISGGHQPMSDPGGSVWVVFNGEIYNFRELRAELERRGHAFRTNSDTEVIVHGYREWQDGVLDRLSGMFGLAVWDTGRRRLLLARDRMGIKPLYYRRDAEGISFASEMRALRGPGGGESVDRDALYLFLRYRFTPSPFTLVSGIRKLAAGHKLTVEDGRCEVQRWWHSRPVPFDPQPSEADAIEELQGLYRASVERHLVSDVPVGLLLSGGVDSALLLALMSEHHRGWDTFTVGYGEEYRNDELADARRTAALLGAEHRRTLLGRRDFEETLHAVIGFLEEPVATASIVAMYHVSRAARERVKVALCGQGPDELFGGYRRHLGVAWGRTWRAIPAPLRAALKPAVSAFTRSETVHRAFDSLDISPRLERYEEVLALMPHRRICSLLDTGAEGGRYAGLIRESWGELEPALEPLDELGGLQYIELRSTLPDELLMYTDKLSMAHGLEMRVPYLDPAIVGFVERLGPALKIRGRRQKWLHRRVCARYLPREILERKKRGFTSDVVDEWFRTAVHARGGDSLRDPAAPLYGHLGYPAVQRVLDEHIRGVRDNHKLLFSLMSFNGWLESWFDGRRSPGAESMPLVS